MKHIWKKSPAAHLLFACLLSIALLPGCIQDPYEMQGSDRISFGATTAAPDGGASTKGGDGLSLLADGWFVALGAEEGSDVAWQPEPQTKTSYSGYDEDGNLISNTAGTNGTNTTSAYERIDWVAGDSVTVISSQAYVRDRSTTPYGVVQSHGTYSRMNYGVTDLGTPSGQNHSAKLSPADGEGLLWDNSNNNSHYFFAVYPATAADNFSPYSTSTADFSGEILDSQPPKDQRTFTENGRQVLEFLPDMEKVYMYAVKNGNRSGGSDIALNFTPMVSAARFTIRAADVGGGTLKLQKAILETTNTSTSYALAGKMSYRINYNGNLTVNHTDTKQYVEIPLPDVQLGDRDIRLTFITLRSQHYNLKLTLKFEGGVTRSLELKLGTSNINWPQDTKLYFDLAGISYMPSYDLPDAIWGWTQDVFTAPVPENVVDGDGAPATPTVVSYRFKDGTGTNAVATVSGDQITCGTSAGKRILVASVTVGSVTTETEIPVYVQKLDRVECPTDPLHVYVGNSATMPYTVYWQRPKDDGTLEVLSTTDATGIYNATTADLAGFGPEVSIPATSAPYVMQGNSSVTVKGVAPIADPGVPVVVTVTDGSGKTTHAVSGTGNVVVDTPPPFESAQIGYKTYTPNTDWRASTPTLWAGDGSVGRIFAVKVTYEDGSYDVVQPWLCTWSSSNESILKVDQFGRVTVGNEGDGSYSNVSLTATFTDRAGEERTVRKTFSVLRLRLSFKMKNRTYTPPATSPTTHDGRLDARFYTVVHHSFVAQYEATDTETIPTYTYTGWTLSAPYDIRTSAGNSSTVWYGGYFSNINADAYWYTWIRYKKEPSTPVQYDYSGTFSRKATRDKIPYAESDYQNHANSYSPVVATASLSWNAGE